jgi:hypothetical protein
MTEMDLKGGDPVTIVRGSNNYLSIIPVTRTDLAEEVTAAVLQNETS